MGREVLEDPPGTFGALQSTGAAPTFQHLLECSSTLCRGCHFLGCREHKYVDLKEQAFWAPGGGVQPPPPNVN